MVKKIKDVEIISCKCSEELTAIVNTRTGRNCDCTIGPKKGGKTELEIKNVDFVIIAGKLGKFFKDRPGGIIRDI